MINTQLNNPISNTQKKDLKPDNLKDKTKPKENSKDILAQTLKHNLGLKNEETLTQILQNETSTKLKELIHKLLNQINAQKNPHSPILKQGQNLNLAPNFANELKALSTELAKNDTFTQVLDKLAPILKPASEIKNNNLAPLFQNSGIFLEAKLKDALNEELLPKSFHALLSTIKRLSNQSLSAQIAQLANTNLNPKDALKELKNILYSNKNENKQILNQSSFKPLLKLISKLENYKNYISKNPIHAQEKIATLSNKILKELTSIKHEFFKALNKPENLMIKNTNILKQSAKAFEKLEHSLKDILNKINLKPQNHTPKKQIENNFSNDNYQNIKKENKENQPKFPSTQDSQTSQEQEKIQENNNTKQTNKDYEHKKNNDEIKNTKQDQNLKNTLNDFPNPKNILKENHQNNKNLSEEFKEYPKTNFTQNTQQTNQNFLKNQESIEQNIIKNLAFSAENMDLTQVQDLSKNLNNLSRKINESLLELEAPIHNARLNQIELKALEHKLDLCMKDLAQIKPKTDQDIAQSLHHDVKSTLLQISNLAKNEGNEAIYNQANRLLAQLEINQLMSLANDSINTYLPFAWDDLNDSRIIFRRGKKDKFFAQIKLEFVKLGNLEVLVSLNNEKYIDINIMAENKDFRKTIYENAHELKKNINKTGLLSANFFIGDIIRNKLDTRNMKNLDLEIGMDKKV
ncbi:flagellar hook-length control protein FliK [Campylobacter sp. VicNov18]|uniref:flagellar hook-length control protein FliK n=1 Tax=Campylobacter bilis TaxID=2691918 RepID=UPI00130E3F5A|nr:flagellar hook-length control protein FliK [Campylobacter bilis]MPV63545.1 flagellar hook-length control protein FliK [Campylobacter hepaticus]MBM0637045.1 flagellar hook-length control protein FliK [Campylobacter bilis]MCC8277797.1 flagellar hook-length control protein FliK [Campylobacter bilis]MCC8299406.1 flagellar hook-length control protein FliK [Campylobacter bilis]MCC8300706.1 flagellar hook-length control protein FliK [Campylobacter bilis]